MNAVANNQEPNQALAALFEHMGRIEASHLYLAAGAPPMFRVADVSYPGRVVLTSADLAAMTASLLSKAQQEHFNAKRELKLAVALSEQARFYVQLCWERGGPCMVVRAVRTQHKTLEQLGLPEALKHAALARSGLIVVAGERGSGKSSTLAALVEHRNASQTGHILTIDDPIEHVHAHKQSIVTQREVGGDTRSALDALRSAEGHAPDLIVVDVVRNAESMEALLDLADRGYLCATSVFAHGASDAVARLLHWFSGERRAEAQQRLARALRLVVVQQLLPSADGRRVPAYELLIGSPRVHELIKNGELDALAQVSRLPGGEGCESLEDALFGLIRRGQISDRDGLRAAGAAAPELQRRLERLRSPQTSSGQALRLAPEPSEAATPAAQTASRPQPR